MREITQAARSFVPIVMLAIITCLPLTSLAQSDSPSFTPANRSAPIDPASLTLTPADIANVGLTGFGLAGQSSLRDAEAESDLESGGDAKLAAELLRAYQADGFRFRYVGSLLRPKLPLEQLPSGFFAAEQRLNTSVAEYATSQGAASSFN